MITRASDDTGTYAVCILLVSSMCAILRHFLSILWILNGLHVWPTIKT